MRKKTILEFIEESKAIFGDKYEYNKTVFCGVKNKVTITCKVHGDFQVTPDNHINNKCGCPKCSNRPTYNTSDWIERCKIKHNNKYDYTNAKYINAHTKVEVICHEKDEFGIEHGPFLIRASNHINGTGCPKCGHRHQMTTDEFIKKAINIHGDKYDYSKVDYKNSLSKVSIICPEHGEFLQQPSSHLQGVGCPKCNNGIRFTINDFIAKSTNVHGNKYDYSKVEYKNIKTPVKLVCKRHGDFYQIPELHLRGCGCPKCKSSKLEDIIINALKEKDIDYIYQSKILNLGNQSVDFYIPSKKLIIECQGEQHYNTIQFNRLLTKDELQEELHNRQEYDKEKYKKSVSDGVLLIYFTIPQYFNNPNTNVRSGFYKNKKVFTDKDELLEYIENLPSFKYNSVYNEINESINNIGTITDNFLYVNGYAIKYIDFGECDRDGAVEFMRSQNKKNRNPIIIFPDEYQYNKKIVLNKIKHICCVNNKLEKIYARKCTISTINKDIAKQFLEANHIQGYALSTIHIGCYSSDNLVGVMSFLREDNDNNWNLTRFATDNNFNCCGVGGKLFNYFIKNYTFNTIKSFADRRWTCNPDDNLYIKLGFVKHSIERKDYRYYNQKVDKYKRFHKFGFRKEILHRKYGLPLSMTEKEMTEQIGFSRIWDCGLIKYVYTNPNKI